VSTTNGRPIQRRPWGQFLADHPQRRRAGGTFEAAFNHSILYDMPVPRWLRRKLASSHMVMPDAVAARVGLPPGATYKAAVRA
jgi:hypothetical protein